MKRKRHISLGIILLLVLIMLFFIKFLNNSPPSGKVEKEFKVMLVNKENKLDKEYVPDLVKYNGFKVSKEILNDLKEMSKASSKDNTVLYINNAYRTYKEQDKLFNDKVKEYQDLSKEEAIIKANETVEQAGYSEHQTGRAIDFSMRNNDYNWKMWYWLKDNSYKYGFILRYPKEKEEITKINYEPWHFTYVSKEVAQIMHDENLCLEEYYQKYIEKEG